METFQIKSGDTEPPLDVELLSNAAAVDLTNATEVRLRMRAAEGGPLLIDEPMTVTSAVEGLVRYQWVDGDTDAPGDYDAEYVVFWPTGEQTFPEDGYSRIEIFPGLDATTSLMPDLPDVCWPVDDSVCSDFANASLAQRTVAKSRAGQTLRMLTGYRVGGCSVTVRPCKTSCVAAAAGWYTWGAGWMPYINGLGVWVNGCCGASTCDHLGAASIILPGPVGEVVEVLIDGEIIDPSEYRVDNGNELVRLDGLVWPTLQDMTLAADAVGAFSVEYLRGIPVDGLGARAAGLLACEYARDMQGLGCKLPSNVTSITRQGISMELTPGAFPGGVTGIREVDEYIRRWNPNALKAPTTVWSPDLQHSRVTTL